MRPQSFPSGCLPAFRQEGAMVDSAGVVPSTASSRRRSQLPLLRLRIRLWRMSHDSLARRGCGELTDGALHLITLTIALLGRHRVVVGRLCLETVDAHAERRVRMTLVQPDGRFRRLAQVLGIRTVAHDAVMHVRTPGVVGCPPDNGQAVASQLKLWPFGDLDAFGFLHWRKYLSGGWITVEYGADGGCDRQCQKQSVHGHTSKCCTLERQFKTYGGRARPHTSRSACPPCIRRLASP